MRNLFQELRDGIKELKEQRERRRRFPFLFVILKDNYLKNHNSNHLPMSSYDKWIVIISEVFDYTYYETQWFANDEELPVGSILQADLDHYKELYKFNDEESALDFIEKWWIKEAIKRSTKKSDETHPKKEQNGSAPPR